ncbi:MAG TPA: MarR family winged helix-turn-helix transcriptional regulator [Xanthobacteraceae bacterium]|nr:MarR family winged helix-turn-helix transcriptional regulator [Xanthobacteraceae bacterium]
MISSTNWFRTSTTIGERAILTRSRNSTREAGPADRRARAAAPLTIKRLLSYQLHQVANLLSRGAAMRYRREFGVSLWEWRTIALLGAQAPQSLNDLASAAALDKSQMSRVVSGLIARGLVSRAADSRDGRGIRLALTKAGTTVHLGLMRAATERNNAFLGCLDKAERACLERALAKIADEARTFIHHENELARARVRRAS